MGLICSALKGVAARSRARVVFVMTHAELTYMTRAKAIHCNNLRTSQEAGIDRLQRRISHSEQHIYILDTFLMLLRGHDWNELDCLHSDAAKNEKK